MAKEESLTRPFPSKRKNGGKSLIADVKDIEHHQAGILQMSDRKGIIAKSKKEALKKRVGEHSKWDQHMVLEKKKRPLAQRLRGGSTENRSKYSELRLKRDNQRKVSGESTPLCVNDEN